jgi:hypothetical protein
MNHDSSFPDPLEFRDGGMMNGTRIFVLTHYFRYVHPDWPIITVPAGTRTDGASIPRCFHALMGPFGSYFKAAVVHDYLYSKHSCRFHAGIDRPMADSIFLQAMEDCGVGWITRNVIFYAVRAFGWIPYKRQ